MQSAAKVLAMLRDNLASDLTCEDQLQATCDIVSSGDIFVQITTKLDDETWFMFVALASALLNGIFFLFMWFIPKLQVHPMKLFMYIMFCDTVMLVQYALSLRTCEYQFYKLFAKTVLFDTSCEGELRAAQILLKNSLFCCVAFTCASLIFQMCISFDLIMTLKKPFTSKEARMPYYIALAVGLSTFQATLVTWGLESNAIVRITEWNSSLQVIVLWILGIGSIIYGFLKLCKPGIS